MVELNAAIMVACMPACASFIRHFSAQSNLISSIKSRLALSGSSSSSPEKGQRASHSSPEFGSESRSQDSYSRSGKYWKLSDAFGAKENVAPQITGNQQQTRVFRSGDWDYLSNGRASATEITWR